ncbi:uncharacterized protein LOC123696222 [Colias croceus]|uniref:uncharacterized protein LOC123696222 n=1 Tax=Colias crocea TaxID=72248 RepID=UPI001E281242|nr:uncharacterized protein LOC123696222 [Colias croceus]
MSVKMLPSNYYEDDEDEELNEDQNICWSNLLFLPFNPTFKAIVLVVVIIKTVLGPIQAVYPIVYCWDTLDYDTSLILLKSAYLYLCDPIYSIDTLLHILHRQITEEALRREYLPKSGFLILLDIISLIPFFSLLRDVPCARIQFSPNIYAFTEIVIIYRIADYFSILSSHKPWQIIVGYTIVFIIAINGLTCFFLLLTFLGFCNKCDVGIYDWRKFVYRKLKETDLSYSTYIYAYSYILTFFMNDQIDDTKPSTIKEYIFMNLLMIVGYIFITFVIIPKMVAESMLKFRRMGSFYRKVQKIIEETKRRNISPKAHIDVKQFYCLMWKKRSGITSTPEVISEIPRYLRLEIRQDLVWPVFYHSPTFRKTSSPYKRWLCETIRMDFKLPGEKFFAGPNCNTHLYYIKSGKLQLISSDDGVTPLITLTSGTLIGDISFYVPPQKRKVIAQCITYCEVLYITRVDILNSLHKHPVDRKLILSQAMERIRHAKTLYTCKQHVRGLDRSEDEGLAWVKKRWWEISDIVRKSKRFYTRRDVFRCQMPAEDNVYHCSKYIGQLVLSSEKQLLTKSSFIYTRFPWIFVPNSCFTLAWHRVVVITVVMVLIFYPPYLSTSAAPVWFEFFQFWTNLIYLCDICVTVLTGMEDQENIGDNYTIVIFAHCKTVKFILDVLSSVWIETFAVISGFPQLYNPLQFNRLIKIYILFSKWDLHNDPFLHVNIKIGLIIVSFIYISAYFLFMIDRAYPLLSTPYFFGEFFCDVSVPKSECQLEKIHPFYIVLAWLLEFIFYECSPQTLMDTYIITIVTYLAFLFYINGKTDLVAMFYLKYREILNYQYFVDNIKDHYRHFKIHPGLLSRLNKYLNCHWKYFNGMDVLHPNLLKNEPYDIFWKLHGEVAEKIIKESCAFAFADHSLIRELAYKAKFLLLPKNCTLSVFGVHTKTLTWVVQGYILSEYHDLHGDLHQRTYNPGEFVSTCAVFLGKPSLRTVYAYTECEVLYVKVRDFFNILKHFPNEVIHFEMCLEKFGPTYDKMLGDHIKKYKHDRKRSRFSVSSVKRPHGIQHKSRSRLKLYNFSHWWFDPSSRFIQIWMILRVMIAILAIVVTSLQGGSGACIRKPLKTIGDVCDFIGYVDIFIKCLLAYYDGRGLLITDLSKRLKHYISRGFILDVIGCVPLHPLINVILSRQIDGNEEALINTTSKFALMYLILGYFNYLADLPHRNNALYMILKLQVLTILVLLGTSHYFVSRCISFNWDSDGNLQNMTSREHCWLPSYLKLDKHPTIHQLHVVYAESFNLAQGGLMRFNLGKFRIDREYFGMGIVLCVLGVMFWYVMCYSLTLLVLNFRGNTIFQHAVSQLRRFLQAERVENKIIDGAIAHFRYWWFRTKGINIQNLMNERIGVVFRQDLAYYFFKNTIETADTLLRGGENLQRQIVSVAVQWYFLPDQTIIREMDLSPWVYIIHRGNIIIKQDNQLLAKLSQGSIFGQLDGNKPRPVRITAVSDGYADLLQIPIKDFQEIIEDEVREIIFNNPESKFDYLAAKKTVVDTPYNTIPYILRGRKTIKLPWMKESFRARTSSWYARWLCFCWLFLPLASAFIVLLANAMPEVEGYIYWMLFVLDVLFALYLVSEFYTLELQIENDRCVERIIKFRMFKKWGYYVDILSLILPIFTHITGNWNYRFARLLRLRLFYYFHLHFCKGFKSQVAPAVLKFVIVFLTIHGMTCGWISVACHHKKFPLELEVVPRDVNRTIDYDEWANPRDRRGGCARMTKEYYNFNGTWISSFIVPRNWTSDYIVAMTYILVMYTHTEIDVVLAITLEEIYYKVFINLIIYPFEIWILSIAISATYTKFRELYTYDYDVESLVLYLEHTGLCPVLLDSLKNYTKQLWERQRGNWLPELAQQAPQCLREDMLSALYMHHLEMPTLFRELPEYFRRQLVTKLQRVVIFPGKFIVQEGDIFSCMYFIHEGEVEKWYTDKSGEKKMLSLLTTNGYFGLIPGLFPNTPYQFSYYSRTVVDFVFLRFHDWQELLHGYPKIKYDLYTGAKLLKKELQKNFMF